MSKNPFDQNTEKILAAVAAVVDQSRAIESTRTSRTREIERRIADLKSQVDTRRRDLLDADSRDDSIAVSRIGKEISKLKNELSEVEELVENYRRPARPLDLPKDVRAVNNLFKERPAIRHQEVEEALKLDREDREISEAALKRIRERDARHQYTLLRSDLYLLEPLVPLIDPRLTSLRPHERETAIREALEGKSIEHYFEQKTG